MRWPFSFIRRRRPVEITGSIASAHVRDNINAAAGVSPTITVDPVAFTGDRAAARRIAKMLGAELGAHVPAHVTITTEATVLRRELCGEHAGAESEFDPRSCPDCKTGAESSTREHLGVVARSSIPIGAAV